MVIWDPVLNVWFSLKSLSLSSINLLFSFLILSISCFNTWSVSSMPSILTRFLSLAFCAATLFFNFLRIIFSSDVRWSRLARFLTGGFASSYSIMFKMSSSSSSSFIDLFNAARAVSEGDVTAGEILITGFCCCLWMALPTFACWKRLWGMTMICCGPDSVATVLTVAVAMPGLTPAPEVGTSMSTIFFVLLRGVGRRTYLACVWSRIRIKNETLPDGRRAFQNF